MPWLHDLDPFLIQFPSGWRAIPLIPHGIRWYGLSYLAGFAVGWLLIRRVFAVTAQQLPGQALDPKRAADLVFAVAIGVVVGGRLGYVLFYRPDLLVSFTSHPPFWGALAMNEGGMASHGGMIGAAIGCWYFAWRNKQPLLRLGDACALATPLGLFFGRIANFINGELYGRQCAADFPLAVRFPQELYERPLPELQAIMHGAPAALRGSADQPYAFVGVLVEKVQAGWPVAREYVEPLLTPRHPSQLYAAVLEGLVVFAVLAWLYRRPVKPGLVAGAFFMTYAVMRVVNEFFRMPDEHLRDAEFAAIGITRGQWLSVLLFVGGLAIAVIAMKRKAEPVGGWRRVG